MNNFMLIIIILTPLIWVSHINYYLNILQQHYYYNSRLIQILKSNFNSEKYYKKISFLGLTFCLGIALITLLNPNYAMLVIFMLMTSYFYLTREKSFSIIPLKITKRVKRLYFIIFLIIEILLFLGFKMPFTDTTNYLFLIFVISLILPLVIIISNYIALPIENIIKTKYLNRAKRKLKETPDIKIIGITGSYGKTTTKNILYDILSSRYQVVATPKSFNTVNGISKTVNEQLNKLTQIFIAEMGVDNLGGMDKHLKFLKPKYAIINNIGYMHLATFKNIDNILKEKIKLAYSLPNDGVVVINNDNEYLSKINTDKIKAKIVTFGIEKEADLMAKNIQFTHEGTRFDLLYKEETYKVVIPLIGKHNVENTLAAISLSVELGVEISDIVKSLKFVKPIPHRLEIVKEDNITFLDDSYNSNSIGFKNALDILKGFKDYRVLITPGMIELGEESYNLNHQLAPFIKDSVDEVILINNSVIDAIKTGLEEMEYTNIKIFNSFKEAKAYVKEKFMDKKVVVLIENDLPDSYIK